MVDYFEAIILREREGKAGGGKGALISDISFTLSTSNFQTLFVLEKKMKEEVDSMKKFDKTDNDVVAYSFDSLSSNSMKSKNPNSGCNEVEISRTIDTAALNPSANQGGIAIVSNEKNLLAFHQKQTPISGNVSPALGTTSDGMGIMIPESKEVMPTLTAANNPSRSPQSSEVTAQIEVMNNVTSSVRRLTPRECERLQGFPDDWTAGQADSSRYRQMGNAVAVPVVEWIVKRIMNG